MGRAISTMHLVCPFCGKHLRTNREHAGREGLCPKCQKIFELPRAPQKKAEQIEEAPEYGSTVVLTLAGGVGLGLLFLACSSMLGWSTFGGAEALFLGAQKLAIVVGSLACLIAIAVALAGRKSLLPAVLVSGAWGITAAVWIAGSTIVMNKVVGGVHSSPVRLGMHVALFAACVVVAISAYLLLQLRHERLFRGLAGVFAGLQVVGVVSGLLIVTLHVAPGLQARSDSTLASMTGEEQQGDLYVNPSAENANISVGNRNWAREGRVRRGQD